MIKFGVLSVNNRGGAGAGEATAVEETAAVRGPLNAPAPRSPRSHMHGPHIYIGHWSEGTKVGAREGSSKGQG